MKKLFLVILCVMLLVMCGCGNHKADTQPTESPVASETPTETPQESSTTPTPIQSLEPSTNKEVVKDETKAPEVYWTMDVAYHLSDCPELENKDNTLVTWQMVKDIGLRQCPKCNPPQYVDYIDIE